MKGLTLDAGALIALDRNDRAVTTMLAQAVRDRLEIVVPAGVVGQVWRDGRKQVRLARFLAVREVAVDSLDDSRARAAGQLCGTRKTRDVIDASVVLTARSRGHTVVTSAPDDLEKLDPELAMIVV